jgi:uncharacterized linocin/CFP29 family protein
LPLSARGGDFELHLGQDVSIGYPSHDASSVELYRGVADVPGPDREAAVSLG